MLTIESLKELGADVDAGLARCMGMEDFYLRLVHMELEDKNFPALKIAMERKDVKAAFEAAHALKGAVGNLSLTPLYAPLCELTELFRGAQSFPETGDLYARLCKAFESLKSLAK